MYPMGFLIVILAGPLTILSMVNHNACLDIIGGGITKTCPRFCFIWLLKYKYPVSEYSITVFNKFPFGLDFYFIKLFLLIGYKVFLAK